MTVLRQARIWAPEKRRQRFIAPHQLSRWYQAVIKEPPLARDFLLVTLLTGMRRREVAGLRWEDIDLKGRTLVVPRPRTVIAWSCHSHRTSRAFYRSRKMRVGPPPGCSPRAAKLGTSRSASPS